MRVSIRVQLGSLLLLSSLIGLGVISIAVWVTVHNFVLNIRASRLSLEALLKAAQLTSNLNLMQTSTAFVSDRLLIQQALRRYNLFGNNSASNWAAASTDLIAALGGSGSLGQSLLLQANLLPVNLSGPAGPYSVLNATIGSDTSPIALPYTYADGSPVYLGANDSSFGYPPILYPTASQLSDTELTGDASSRLYRPFGTNDTSSVVLSGPLMVNDSLSLVSITTPVLNTTDDTQLLGWLTVAMDASLLMQVMEATDGLYASGQTLIVGPDNDMNKYSSNISSEIAADSVNVRYIFPPDSSDLSNSTTPSVTSTEMAFTSKQLPIMIDALQATSGSDYSGAYLRDHDINGQQVSTGYAIAKTSMVDWVVLIQVSRAEVWQPINNLRNTILACVFATAAFMAILSYPLAHFASLPILRLRQATLRSVEPPQEASRASLESSHSTPGESPDLEDDPEKVLAHKEGLPFMIARRLRRMRSDTTSRARSGDEERRRGFRIPGKVKERKGWISDELSDLTVTYNAMTEELLSQYSRLEERVQQRTAELELSKKAAEAANESKTLFIANISHELKTPLNGILGMCAVCMQEDDPIRLKRSLGIIYKSGDLLLNLLTDLLTFSKNQVGQHLTLDEKQFRLRDICLQTMAIFEKQASEGQIDLRVEYEGSAELFGEATWPDLPSQGATETSRVRDMIVWGDMHRILQVIINLTSNSLKFTPAGGSVVLRIRCLSEVPNTGAKAGSLNSKRRLRRQQSGTYASDASIAMSHTGTANSIYPISRDRSPHPSTARDSIVAPPAGKVMYFEFAVSDTGPGIPEEQHDRIFEPFVQGDLGLSKKFGGTGLGLSICSQLAKLMHGSIGLQSSLGAGSTFTLKIPLRHVQQYVDSAASSGFEVRMDEPSRRGSVEDADQRPLSHVKTGGVNKGTSSASIAGPSNAPHGPELAEKSPSTDPQPRLVGLSQPFFAASAPMESPGSQPAAMEKIATEAVRSGRIRVLVAEDNQVNQEVVLRMLKLEDIYDVTVAKDGQEALDFVKESMQGGAVDSNGRGRRPFDLIFMDVQMPNVDGLQSTRLIREIGYRAPIVALTAFAEDSNIKDCLDSGMNYFLSKPIRRPQLKKVLREYCPPIPEEKEDAVAPAVPSSLPPFPNVTPPALDHSDLIVVEPQRSGSHHTIVVVNGQIVEDTAGPSATLLPLQSSHPAQPQYFPVPTGTPPARSGTSPSRLRPPASPSSSRASSRANSLTSRPTSPRSAKP